MLSRIKILIKLLSVHCRMLGCSSSASSVKGDPKDCPIVFAALATKSLLAPVQDPYSPLYWNSHMLFTFTFQNAGLLSVATRAPALVEPPPNTGRPVPPMPWCRVQRRMPSEPSHPAWLDFCANSLPMRSRVFIHSDLPGQATGQASEEATRTASKSRTFLRFVTR